MRDKGKRGKGRRLTRSHRDLELIQRDGEPAAAGFDVSLLTRPAAEERRRLLLLRERAETSLFARREDVRDE